MEARRLRFWLYWVSVTAVIATIGSGVTADANISSKPETLATNVVPVLTRAVATPAPAQPEVTTVAPLADAAPAADLAATKVADQVGIASWYGPQFHGKLTASGERFDQHKLTAAHRTLPLDTKVKVTNLENGKSIEVKVNDRGPYIPGRVLDLSSQAAKELGMDKEGLALVRIEIVGDQVANDAVN